MFLHNLNIGGAQNAVYNLVHGLNTPACRPVVCGWSRGGALEAGLRAAGIAVEVPSRRLTGWRRLGVLRTLIHRHCIDIIHAHMSDSAFWAVLLQQLTARPCVVTHQNNDLIDAIERGRFYRWARHRLLFTCSRRAAANITVSATIRNRLVTSAGVAPERVLVVPNGIRPPAEAEVADACERRRARAASGFAEASGPKILYAGRLIESKGVGTLIAAAPNVIEMFPGASFIVLGDGAHTAALRAQARRLGLAERVLFAGKVEDVGRWFAEADLYASASRLEGLSVVTLEAMSWGLPVVASDIPGHRELVREGDTGRLVPAGAPEALAQACITALQDWRGTAGCAERALALVRNTYRADLVAHRHLEIYRALLDGRNGAGGSHLHDDAQRTASASPSNNSRRMPQA